MTLVMASSLFRALSRDVADDSRIRCNNDAVDATAEKGLHVPSADLPGAVSSDTRFQWSDIQISVR